MRLKPSSRNLVRAALLLFSFPIFISLSGCQCPPGEPATYKEKEIPSIVKRICKDEYRLDVITKLTATTLWIYAPLPKILHKEYGIKEGKVLDEDMTDRLRNIMTTVGRVILSSDKAPEFFALWASDINIGLDYIIIGNVLDMKKAYADSMPFTELNKRYVMKFGNNPEAVQDTTGRHTRFFDISMPDFIAQQITQRIAIQFQAEGLKKYIRLDKLDGAFYNDEFILEYSATPLSKPDKPIDITKTALDVATYCIKTYEFRDFSFLEITDLLTRGRLVVDKAQILARPMPEL